MLPSAQLEKIFVLRICDAWLFFDRHWMVMHLLRFQQVRRLSCCSVDKARTKFHINLVFEMIKYIIVGSSFLYCHHFTFSHDKLPRLSVDFRFVKHLSTTSSKFKTSDVFTSITSYLGCVRFVKRTAV